MVMASWSEMTEILKIGQRTDVSLAEHHQSSLIVLQVPARIGVPKFLVRMLLLISSMGVHSCSYSATVRRKPFFDASIMQGSFHCMDMLKSTSTDPPASAMFRIALTLNHMRTCLGPVLATISRHTFLDVSSVSSRPASGLTSSSRSSVYTFKTSSEFRCPVVGCTRRLAPASRPTCREPGSAANQAWPMPLQFCNC